MLGDASISIADESQASQMLANVLGGCSLPNSAPSAGVPAVRDVLDDFHTSKEIFSDGSFRHSAPQYHFHGLATTQTQTQTHSDAPADDESSQKENTPVHGDLSAGPASSVPPVAHAGETSSVANKTPLTPPPDAYGSCAITSTATAAQGRLAPRAPLTPPVALSSRPAKAVSFVSPQHGPHNGHSGGTNVGRGRSMPSILSPHPRPSSPASQDSFAVAPVVDPAERFVAQAEVFHIPLSLIGRDTQDQVESQEQDGAQTSEVSSSLLGAPPVLDSQDMLMRNIPINVASSFSQSQSQSQSQPRSELGSQFASGVEENAFPAQSQSLVSTQAFFSGPHAHTRSVVFSQPGEHEVNGRSSQPSSQHGELSQRHEYLHLESDDFQGTQQATQLATQATQPTTQPADDEEATQLTGAGALTTAEPVNTSSTGPGTAAATAPSTAPRSLAAMNNKPWRRPVLPSRLMDRRPPGKRGRDLIEQEEEQEQETQPSIFIAPPPRSLPSPVVWSPEEVGPDPVRVARKPSPVRQPPLKRARVSTEDIVPDSEEPTGDDNVVPSSAPEQDKKVVAAVVTIPPSVVANARTLVSYPHDVDMTDIVPESMDNLNQDDEGRSSDEDPDPIDLLRDRSSDIAEASVASSEPPPKVMQAVEERTPGASKATSASPRHSSSAEITSPPSSPGLPLASAVARGKRRQSSSKPAARDDCESVSSRSASEDPGDLPAIDDDRSTEPADENDMDMDDESYTEAPAVAVGRRASARKGGRRAASAKTRKVTTRTAKGAKSKKGKGSAVTSRAASRLASVASTSRATVASANETPVPKAGRSMRSYNSTGKLTKEGTRVFARYSSYGFYIGRVSARIDGGKFQVRYDDGDSAVVSISEMRLGELRIGDRVQLSSQKSDGRVVEFLPSNAVRLEFVKPKKIQVVDLKLSQVCIKAAVIASDWDDRVLTVEDIESPVKVNMSRPTQSPSTRSLLSTGTGIFATTGFVLTAFVSGDKERTTNLIRKAGGAIWEDWPDLFAMGGEHDSANNRCIASWADLEYIGPDHLERVFLLSDGELATSKYLTALALGVPCISHEWVDQSVAEKKQLDWRPFLLPAGKVQTLDIRVSQLIDLDWGSCKDHLHDIKSNNVPARLFADKSLLCVSEEWLKKQPMKRGSSSAKAESQSLNCIPAIILAMGASLVEAVASADDASLSLDDYDYIVMKDLEQPLPDGVDEDSCVSWQWVKDSLRMGHFLPLPN